MSTTNTTIDTPEESSSTLNGGATVVAEVTTKRPEGVPEKFWDAEKGQVNTEALLKSYRELEKSKSQKASEDTEDEPEDAPEEESSDEQPSDETKEQLLDRLPEGMKPYVDYVYEFETKGELSEDSYKSLQEKHNLSKEVVDEYIKGQQALRQSQTVDARTELSEFHNLVGGEEAWKDIAEWAVENLSAEEIDEFNAVVEAPQPNKAAIKIAVRSLKSRYDAEQEPRLIGGRKSATSTPKGYATQEEAAAAYIKAKGDPERLRKHEARLAASTW